MEVTKTKWFGAIVVETKDSEGNRYNTETGRIDLADGRHTVIPEEQRSDMQAAIKSQITAENKKWFGLVVSNTLDIVGRTSPENIIGLAGRHIIAGEEWRHYLGATFAQKLDTFTKEVLTETKSKVDNRTGALCTPSTTLNPFELVELARTATGNPTRFVCTPINGSIYEIDTKADPSATKHLQKPSDPRKSGGMEV